MQARTPHTRVHTHARARRFQQTSDTQARSWKTPTCLFHLRSLTKPQSPAPMGEMCQQKGTCEGAPALCEIVKCLTGPRHVFGNPINTPGPFECLLAPRNTLFLGRRSELLSLAADSFRPRFFVNVSKTGGSFQHEHPVGAELHTANAGEGTCVTHLHRLR